MEAFQNKRSDSHSNYLIVTVDLQRDQKLPLGMQLWLQGNMQWADQALISNEQYIAGGITSVRGYKENEAAGDNAWHATAELRAPDIGQAAGIGRWFECTPYIFYDVASLHLLDTLPGEASDFNLAGAGLGARGYFLKWFEYEVDWAQALEDTEYTEAGDDLFHFIIKFVF